MIPDLFFPGISHSQLTETLVHTHGTLEADRPGAAGTQSGSVLKKLSKGRLQLGCAPQQYPGIKGLMEKSRCDTVNYTLLLWERGADPRKLWMLCQDSSIHMPLPQYSTTAKIPNNGLETTGFVQQFLLFPFLWFFCVSAAAKALLPSP